MHGEHTLDPRPFQVRKHRSRSLCSGLALGYVTFFNISGSTYNPYPAINLSFSILLVCQLFQIVEEIFTAPNPFRIAAVAIHAKVNGFFGAGGTGQETGSIPPSWEGKSPDTTGAKGSHQRSNPFNPIERVHPWPHVRSPLFQSPIFYHKVILERGGDETWQRWRSSSCQTWLHAFTPVLVSKNDADLTATKPFARSGGAFLCFFFLTPIWRTILEGYQR